jgi:lipopolysaccharide transport system permease protein
MTHTKRVESAQWRVEIARTRQGSVIDYIQKIWAARYFWVHLALSDLRTRWRRSYFGILWSMIQPLGLTLLLAFVFSKLFKTDFTTYAPYVLSGVIVWDFVIVSTTGGSLSFVQADAYIKQCRHPLAIYTLRTVLAGCIVLLLASVPLLGWTLLVKPEKFGVTWLALPLFYPVACLIAWPLATILAYVSVRFRDVPHALALVLQAIWFASPVYFEAKLFRDGGLGALVDLNPIYHLLQLMRAPLLEGQWPEPVNFVFALGTAVVLIAAAGLVGRKMERRVIFYL